MHTDFACLLYSKLEQRLNEQEIYSMFEEAVELETEFVTSVLPVDLIGMNKKLMTQYIKFVADVLLVQLGYEKKWNVSNPFDWMDIISIDGKTNFFEKRVGEYSKCRIGNSKDEDSFNLFDDF